MDMAAHMLWVGAALVALSRRTKVPGGAAQPTEAGARDRLVDRRLVGICLVFAVLPDLVHLLPVFAWSLTGGGWGGLQAYVTALPGQEPDMPSWAEQGAHHLHCLFHSGLVLSAIHLVLLLLWRYGGHRRGRPVHLPWPLALPIWAWWSHVLIDVVTHSDDFYPSPVLYPITYAGLDGVAWNRTDFMLLNYLALGLTWAWLFRPWRKRPR